MSDSNNHSNSSASNTSNTTGRQANNPPVNPPIMSSTQPSPSTSIMGIHVGNGRPLDGNHQAQRTTPTDSNINSDYQARDNALNDQNDTSPSAMMIVEHTDDPTVRRLHEAFHTDAPQRPRWPFTRASSIAREMTARDRQEFGLQPDTAQSGSASNNNQPTTSGPDGFDLFETPSSGIPPVAVTDTPVTLGVSRDDYFSLSGALQPGPPQANSSGSLGVSQAADFTAFGFHASELPSYPMRRSASLSGTAALSSHPLGEASDTATMFNSTPLVNERSSDQRPSYSLRDLGLRGDNFNTAEGVYATVHSQADSTNGRAEHSDGSIVENGHGRERASPDIPMDDPPSVNVSDLRLGPVSREPLTEFALFSHYPEEEPNRAVPDEDATASSSAIPVRRRGLVAPLELANHGDRRAPARPNTPVQSQTTGTPPLSDLASHHPGRRASNSSLVHGSTPDNSTRNNTPGYDGRPTRLSDYLSEASPLSEDREAWTVGRIITPENAIEAQRRPNHVWQNVSSVLFESATTSHNAPNNDENGLCSESDTENFRSNTAFDTSASTDHQDTAHLIAHGRIPNSDHLIATSITNNVPESGGNPTYLTDYMEEPLVEERGRWTHAFVAAPVESNARPYVPLASPIQSDQQDRASSAVNNSNVNSRERRAPRAGGSLRQMRTEENDAFCIDSDDSRNS